MSDTLLGVIIGGLIASIGPLITLKMNHTKWKCEKKLEYLKEKRNKLEKACSGTLTKIAEGILKNNYSSDMMSDIDFLFPEKVSKAFENLMKEDDKTELKMQKHYYLIARAMKQSIAELDEDICKIIST